MDVRAKSQIGSIITSLEKRNFTSSVESIDENVSVRTKINGSQSRNENPENNEVDSAEGNSEAVEITYIDDSRNPMNMKAESRLDSKFIYSKGYGESGMTLEPVKKIINESSHGTLECWKSRIHMICTVLIAIHALPRGLSYGKENGSFMTSSLTQSVRELNHYFSLVCLIVLLQQMRQVMTQGPMCSDAYHVSAFLFRQMVLGQSGFSEEILKGENLQSPQQTAARNLSWISAIFETFRVKNARNGPGMETAECVQNDSLQTSGQFQNSSETQTDETIDCVFPVQGGLMPGRSNANVVESVGSEIQNPSQEANQGPSEPGETQVADVMKWDGLIKSNGTEGDNLQPVKEDVNAEHVNPSFQNEGNEFTVSEIPSATNDENSIKVLPVGANSIITSIPGILSPSDWSPSLTYSSRCDNGVNQVTDYQNNMGKVPLCGSNSLITSIPRVSSPNAIQINIKRLEDVATPAGPAADSIQSIEEEIITAEGTVLSQNNQILSSSPAPGTSTGGEMRVDIDQQKMYTTVRHEWDILKSIVYGGLIESVTSLVVVSSAAGSDTNTLNIVALGLANLIGGLFIIAHNLREIKKERVISADQSEERLDRYQETLGRRENFRRHVVATVLSYIIFGLIPPVVYGFSFLRSDDKDYKLIAVAATSFVCIAFLAICKAHVGKAPKTYVKTVLYYICLGILASGLSYVAGQLLNQRLEKLRLSDPCTPAAPTSVFLEPKSAKLAGWASSY